MVGINAARDSTITAMAVARYSTYVKAIKEYYSDYGYYPEFGQSTGGAGQDLVLELVDPAVVEDFWKTLYAYKTPDQWTSGRKTRLDADEAKRLGNRKRRHYIEPNADNHYLAASGDMDWGTIQSASKTPNKQTVFVMIDLDNDGKLPNPDPKTNQRRQFINSSIAFYGLSRSGKIAFKTW